MKTRELKVARIGNSRGVRLPASSLNRYSFGSTLIMEERAEGILLRSAGQAVEKLSWRIRPARWLSEREDWSEWAGNGRGRAAIPSLGVSLEGKSGKRDHDTGAKPSPGKETVKAVRSALGHPGSRRGAEMAKTSPVVIVSLDELNARLQTVTMCPVTSRLHPAWRCRLRVQCGGRPAEIAVDQIRTVSRSRLASRIGTLAEAEAAALRRLITEMFGERDPDAAFARRPSAPSASSASRTGWSSIRARKPTCWASSSSWARSSSRRNPRNRS